MRRLMTVLSCAGLLAATHAAASAATPAAVERAIERGKGFLYNAQKAGHWETADKPTFGTSERDVNSKEAWQWGGQTAATVYALLACGESHREPKLAPAVEFMKKADLKGTYAISMRMLAMSFLPETPENIALVRRDHATLMKLVRTERNARGMYDYYDRAAAIAAGQKTGGGPNAYSHSRAQYGVLGVWIAGQMGIESPTAYWKMVEDGWIRNQDASGGWTYRHPSETNFGPTPGMTGAGIATLYLAQDYTLVVPEPPRGNVKHPAIEKGTAWMTANIQKALEGQKYQRSFTYVTLYAMERIGVASGLKYYGKFDWFNEGADFLIGAQRGDGSWQEGDPFTGRIIDTDFALLFLARGRAPVVVQKLEYDVAGKEGHWNQRPRDVANIVRFYSRQAERDLNWQIANLRAPVEDLFDSPILYISGNQALAFSDADVAKLKAYVDGGGLIVGHADAGSAPFADSFQKLGAAMFKNYEFRPLPEKHPALALTDARGGPAPRVVSRSNGVRELMMLIQQGDPARFWQMQSFKAERANAAQLMMGIMLYASEKKSLRVKGEDVLIKTTGGPPRTNLKVARIEYEGNWDPEPGAWPRLGRYLHNTKQTAVATAAVKPAGGNLQGYKLAHLTGTATFRLADDAKEELKRFIAAGGTLLVESAGGNDAFAASAREIVKDLTPGGKEISLADHKMLAEVGEARYRTYSRRIGRAGQQTRLKGVELAGRVAVIVSEEDLSGGWVGHQFDAVHGYDPATALKIGAALVTAGG